MNTNKLNAASVRRGTKTYKHNLKSFREPKRVKNWSPMKEARMLKRVRWPDQRQMHNKALKQACYRAARRLFGEDDIAFNEVYYATR